MRKLGRIVRRVLTAVSLLLFVAVLAAWVRGYWSWDRVVVHRDSIKELVRRSWSVQIDWSGGEIGARMDLRQSDPGDEEWARGVRPFLGWHSRFDGGGNPGPVTWAFFTDPTWAGRRSTIYNWSKYVHGIALVRWEGCEIRDSGRAAEYGIAFPCWMAAIVFGALPSWRGFVWWRAVRRRRVALLAGRCGVCGYDLRASPQRCPKCGTAVGKKGE